MNFLSLRADKHAQWEIQQFAEAMTEAFAAKMPWTYAAFLAHVWKGENPKLHSEKEKLCAAA
jgi:thymidylate synthase (FAD)